MNAEAEVQERKYASSSSPGGGTSGPSDPAATEAAFQQLREKTKARQAQSGGV